MSQTNSGSEAFGLRPTNFNDDSVSITVISTLSTTLQNDEETFTKYPFPAIRTEPSKWNKLEADHTSYDVGSSPLNPTKTKFLPILTDLKTAEGTNSKLPIYMNCPKCNDSVNTKVIVTFQKKAVCYCCIVCMLGGMCGCCLIPCARYKKVSHICPSCKKVIGSYNLPVGDKEWDEDNTEICLMCCEVANEIMGALG